MKLFFSLLATLCLFFSTQAQEYTPLPAGKHATAIAILPPLKPGDYLPSIAPCKALNNDGRLLDLAAFKGKLLILDFWSTTCGACIQAMPRLDSLANLYKDQLVILPVTAEKAERITAFQQSNAFLKGWKFRTVVEDKNLHALFPHRLLPHEVWIDPTGKVLGFTEATAVTAATIEQALAGKGLTAAIKEDILDYDRHKPLLLAGNGGSDTAYRYRSVITGMLKGLPSGMGFSYDSLKRMTIVRATNVSARRLYMLAYKGLRSLPDSNVDMGNISGLYCYELDLPSASPSLVRRSIREDLDRFFGVQSEWSGNAFRLSPLPDDSVGDGPLTL
jgi:thiol-disulfide isomerase/thioredoxin